MEKISCTDRAKIEEVYVESRRRGISCIKYKKESYVNWSHIALELLSKTY
jgi:hypothetical protein